MVSKVATIILFLTIGFDAFVAVPFAHVIIGISAIIAAIAMMAGA